MRVSTSSLLAFVGLVAVLGTAAVFFKVREVQNSPRIRFIQDESINEGARLLEAGDEKKAEKEFQKAVARSPQSIEIRLAVAMLYNRDGKREQTLAYVKMAEPLARTYRDWVRLGDLAMGANAPIEQTEFYYLQCLRMRPNDPLSKNNLAYSYALANVKLGEAERFVKEAMAASTSSAAYIDTLGWVYYRQARYREAQRELEMAVALDSTSPDLREHLGEVYKKLGLKTRAEVEFYKAKILRGRPPPRPRTPTE